MDKPDLVVIDNLTLFVADVGRRWSPSTALVGLFVMGRASGVQGWTTVVGAIGRWTETHNTWAIDPEPLIVFTS